MIRDIMGAGGKVDGWEDIDGADENLVDDQGD